MIKILIFPQWKEWKEKRSFISLADAANGRDIPPYGFSFFSRVSRPIIIIIIIKNIFSLVITRVNFYQHLLMKLQKRCYATAPVQNFVATFPETIFLRAACIATLQCLNHYLFSYIFIPTNFTFLVCMSLNFCNDGWAGRER